MFKFVAWSMMNKICVVFMTVAVLIVSRSCNLISKKKTECIEESSSGYAR